MIEIAKICLIALAVIVWVGGFIGYVKAESKASLIAGSISGVVLACCAFVMLNNPTVGLIAGLVVSFLLDGVFAMRLKKTKKFMPSGLMLILCGVFQVTAILSLVLH